MTTLIAHIAGVPVEELLVPLGSVGVAAIAASLAGKVRAMHWTQRPGRHRVDSQQRRKT
jgi:hypothetical protein